jgi:catechol 2,3-dioxygenase-like lactoylglutathione lyase family enzyme
MFSHVSVGVSDMERATAFYDPVLRTLGIEPIMPIDVPGFGRVAMGYGRAPGHVPLWVQLPHNREPATAGNGTHVAFAAVNRQAVDDFYAAALAHGGTSDGPPGPRTMYSPDYYGAFVRDPDGNKLEACLHEG